jgi:hypothetical protein
VVRPVQEFLHLEVAGGVVLAVATVLALLWANVDEPSYTDCGRPSSSCGSRRGRSPRISATSSTTA